MAKQNGVKNKMFTKQKLIIFLVILEIFQSNIAIAKSTLTTSGDVLQIALPVAAISTSFLKNDREGEKEFMQSFLVNLAITNSLKFVFKDTGFNKRPNGKNYSFPSGHTATAFGGAFFLQKRYGSEYGVPAIGLAALTGYSRVKGNYHYWRDVIGGMFIAFTINHVMVSEYKPKDLTIAVNKSGLLFDYKLNF